MWKLKISEGNDPYLITTNNFVGRQFWEFDPNAGTPEERQEVENARQNFLERKKEGFQTSSDLLMRIQLIRENGIDVLSIPPAMLKEDENVSYEAVTTATRKAVRLIRAIQAKDGHWATEHAGPLFFTPPLAERDPKPLHIAAKILINAQMDNGDFPQENMTGASMRNCMLHYPLYRNIFPLLALSEYRKRFWVK